MKEKMTRNEIIFLGAYILYFIAISIRSSELFNLIPVPSMIELLKLLAVMVVGLKIISDRNYTNKSFLIFCLVTTIIFISCIRNRNFELLYTVFFIFGIKDISYHKVLKITFIIRMIFFIIIAVGIWMGFVPNYMTGTIVWSSTMISDEIMGRYSLGFGHPNIASAIVLFISLVYICMKKKYSFLELIVSLGINYMVYQKTGSRTCFLVTIIFFPLMYWFANKKKFQRYWQVLFTIAPLIIILTATFAHVFYNPNNILLAKINTLLSSRLQLGHQGMLDYGITLFGQKTVWIADFHNEYGLPYNYVDSAYMRILLDNGVIVFILLCIVSVVTMYRLAKIKNGKLCIAFLAVLVHSMVEMTICYMSWEPFCLLMGQMIIQEDCRE